MLRVFTVTRIPLHRHVSACAYICRHNPSFHTSMYIFLHSNISLQTYSFNDILISFKTIMVNHTYTYSIGHTRIQAYMHVFKHTYTYSNIHTRIQSYIHVSKHTYPYSNIHTRIQSYIHVSKRTYTCISIHEHHKSKTLTFIFLFHMLNKTCTFIHCTTHIHL